MPKLKGMRFATAAVERRIEDASEALRGAGVSAGAVSNPNGKAFKAVEERRRGPLARECPYACIDGVYLERSRGGSCGNVAAMVTIGVNEDGYREVVGCAESSERWRGFLSRLKSRGLRGVRMFAGDKAAGMAGPIAEAFPDAKYRRRAATPSPRPRPWPTTWNRCGPRRPQGSCARASPRRRRTARRPASIGGASARATRPNV